MCCLLLTRYSWVIHISLGNRLRTTERDLTLIWVLFIGLRLGYLCRKKENLMRKVAILPEPSVGGSTVYRAVAGARQARAEARGGGFDARSRRLPPGESGTLGVVPNPRADQFF